MPITVADFVNADLAGKTQMIPWSKVPPSTPAAGGVMSLWAASGVPGAGGYGGSALAATQCDKDTAGALAVLLAGSGSEALWLKYLDANAPQASTIELWDRLLVYDDISHASTLAQTLTNPVTLPRYTTGEGVQMFLEAQTAIGATPQNVTVTYTDSDGNGSNSTGAQAIVTSSGIGRCPHAFHAFPLAAGDRGVRSAESIIFSAASTGTSALVLAKRIAAIPVTVAGLMAARDLLRQGGVEEISATACLMLRYLTSTTTAGGLGGEARISRVAPA